MVEHTGLFDMPQKTNFERTNNVRPNNIAGKQTRAFRVTCPSKLSTRPFLNGRKWGLKNVSILFSTTSIA